MYTNPLSVSSPVKPVWRAAPWDQGSGIGDQGLSTYASQCIAWVLGPMVAANHHYTEGMYNVPQYSDDSQL
jgi:hypothetical protein